MKTALHMQASTYHRNLNTSITVASIQAKIALQFSGTWRSLIKKRAAHNFLGVVIPEKPSARIKTSLGLRDEWLRVNGPKIMVDFRNPIADERVDQVIFSDQEYDTNNNNDLEDSENELDDLYI